MKAAKASVAGRPRARAARGNAGGVLTTAGVKKAVRELGSPTAARFAAAKALVATAEARPQRVYGQFDAIVPHLSERCKIVKWNAMQMLAAVAGVDSVGKICRVLDTYIGAIAGDNMITAANAVKSLATIAEKQPAMLEPIVAAFLGVERAQYETDECRNVVTGHVLRAMEQLWGAVGGRADVRGFVERQKGNRRESVRKLAEKLAGK